MQHSYAALFAYYYFHLIAVYAYMRFYFEQGCLIARLCSLLELVSDRLKRWSMAVVDCR